jgi:hypothetical protein
MGIVIADWRFAIDSIPLVPMLCVGTHLWDTLRLIHPPQQALGQEQPHKGTTTRLPSGMV